MEVVFSHRTGFRENDVFEEVMKFDEGTTEDQITEAYIEWILEQVEDQFTWYIKEEK